MDIKVDVQGGMFEVGSHRDYMMDIHGYPGLSCSNTSSEEVLDRGVRIPQVVLRVAVLTLL